MNRLATIDDLLQGDPAQIAALMARASVVADRFERFLDDDDRGETERSWGIHASELSCLRKTVYSLLDTKRVGAKIGKDWKRRFKIGHAVHDMFQADFARMAKRDDLLLDFEAEIPIRPDLQDIAAQYFIYSHADGLFTLREKKGGPDLFRIVVELKTKSPAEYEKLQAPEPEHLEQAHVYMKCLNAPMTWFLYYNKGNQNYTSSRNQTFFVPFNTSIWDGIVKKIETANEYAGSMTLPPRSEGVRCEFCAFSYTCNPTYLRRRQGVHTPPSRWLKVKR